MLKYEGLVSTLRSAITGGTYKKGDRLPTTPELCQIYGVSNTTVKKAMDELELQGLVARRRGSGVYVKGLPSSTTVGHEGWDVSSQMTGFSAEYTKPGDTVISEVHDFSVIHPSAEICNLLGMELDEFAYQICRVRIANGQPRVVEYTNMPIKLIPDLRETHLESSIYHYIEDELGLKIGSAHRRIKAVMPTPDERTWLKLGESEPLLEVRQGAYLDDGTPFEYSISRHVNDYEFRSISTR